MADGTKNPTAKEILSKDNSGATANVVSDAVAQMSAGSPLGPVSNVMGDSFYGINHTRTPGAIPVNKDDYGLTFFTRPLLNFTTENLGFARILSPLMSEDENSIQRIMRCYLDPRQERKFGIKSPFVDPLNPFISILTNSLLSIAGWPDTRVLYSSSHEGVYKETFSFIDGPAMNYGTYELTANFRNMPGNPIAVMMDYWYKYAAFAYDGTLNPYPDMIINNERDYNTRIYRLVLDQNRRYVTGIAVTGASFPVNSSMGAIFNYEAERPINNGYDQVSINFVCDGAIYNDPIHIRQFNRIVQIFNPAMTDGNREQFYRPLTGDITSFFKYNVYPRIDEDTYELQWWAPYQTYDAIMARIKQYNQSINNQG